MRILMALSATALAALLIQQPALAASSGTIDCPLRAMSTNSQATYATALIDDADAGKTMDSARAFVTPLAESQLADVLMERPAQELKGAPRQVIEVEIDNTMTSCGYGVPVMQLVRDRRVVDRGRRYKEDAASAAAPQVAPGVRA